MEHDLPALITEKRLQMGLNKAKLAVLLNISSAAVGQYESGKIAPKIEMLFKLNKALKFDFINNKPLVNESLTDNNAPQQGGDLTVSSGGFNGIYPNNKNVTKENSLGFSNPPRRIINYNANQGEQNISEDLPDWSWKMDILISNQNKIYELMQKQKEIIDSLFPKNNQ